MTPTPRGPQQQSVQHGDNNHVSQDSVPLNQDAITNLQGSAAQENADKIPHMGASTAACQEQESQIQDSQSEMYQDGYFPPTDDSPPPNAALQSGDFTETFAKTRYGEESDLSVEKALDNATDNPNESNVVPGEHDFVGTQEQIDGFSGTQVKIQKQRKNSQSIGASQDQVIGARGPLYGAAAEAKRGHLMGAAAEAKKGHLMGAAAENVKGNLQGAAAIAHEQKMQRESGQGQLQSQTQQRVLSGNGFDPKGNVIGSAAQTTSSDRNSTQGQMAQKESKRVNELDETAIPAKQMKYDEFNLRNSPQTAH